MYKHPLTLVSFFISLAIACTKDESNAAESYSYYKQGTITYTSGFDFSEGTGTDDWDLQDGYTTTVYNKEEKARMGVWYTSGLFGEASVKCLGNKDLASIKEIDTTSWDNASTERPLLQDEVWVVKCKDGYAKFKVLSTFSNDSASTGDNFRNAKVEISYLFSTTNQFIES